MSLTKAHCTNLTWSCHEFWRVLKMIKNCWLARRPCSITLYWHKSHGEGIAEFATRKICVRLSYMVKKFFIITELSSLINLIWTWNLNLNPESYSFLHRLLFIKITKSRKKCECLLFQSHFFLHALHSWPNYVSLNAPPFLVATYDRLICLNKFLWFAAFTLLSLSFLVIRIFHCPTYYIIGRYPVWHVARFVHALIIIDMLSIINR